MAMWPMTDPDDRHHVHLWPLQNTLLPHVMSLARLFDESQASEPQLKAEQTLLALLFDAAL
jgi:hypothetical protein